MYDKSLTVLDRREMLRVKIKSLTAEAHIIRQEEERNPGCLRDELRVHRTTSVRFETRATHPAYGLIRGRTIERIEVSTTRTEALWKKVRGMIERYGPVAVEKRQALLAMCRQ